jgi:hypothetical protein
LIDKNQGGHQNSSLGSNIFCVTGALMGWALYSWQSLVEKRKNTLHVLVINIRDKSGSCHWGERQIGKHDWRRRGENLFLAILHFDADLLHLRSAFSVKYTTMRNYCLVSVKSDNP